MAYERLNTTKKWPNEGHAEQWLEDVEMTVYMKKLVNRRWEEYAFTKD